MFAPEEKAASAAEHDALRAECLALAEELVALLKERKKKITFAESCTAGLLAGTFCSVPGASAVFDGSAVTYANEVKASLLGVPGEVLASVGAVSAPCALEMAKGAARLFGADLAVSVTGIAGPAGGTPEKPVGTVFFGVCLDGELFAARRQFDGDRDAVRLQSVRTALRLAKNVLTNA